jgi:hypothetical protein
MEFCFVWGQNERMRKEIVPDQKIEKLEVSHAREFALSRKESI